MSTMCFGKRDGMAAFGVAAQPPASAFTTTIASDGSRTKQSDDRSCQPGAIEPPAEPAEERSSARLACVVLITLGPNFP